MSRRRLAVLVAVLVSLLGGGLWWWLAHGVRHEPTDPSSSESAGPARAAIVAAKRARRDRGEIDLRPASVSGRVLDDATGKPITGAVVLLTAKGFGDPRSSRAGKQAEPAYARTDVGGSFELDDVAPGRYALSASARGYLPARLGHLDVTAGRDNPDHTLRLKAGGHELTGVVLDVAGGPVPDAMVQITRLDEGNIIDFGRAPTAVLTDDDGKFATHVPVGSFTVAAAHPEYVGDAKTVQVEGPRHLELVLTPGATISGTVRVLPGGEALPGAIVLASPADEGSAGFVVGLGGARVVTDAAGRFELRGLASGVHAVSAIADAHATREPVEVPLGIAEQVTGVEIWVDRAFKISGFVVRQDDQEEGGIEGVLVGAFALQPPSLFAPKDPSGDDGYFEIIGVRPGNYLVGAIGEEALPNLMGTSAQVVDADVSDVLVVMNPGATVRGRVSPPGAASVQVMLDVESMGIGNMLDSIGNALLRARAGDDGVFELRPVAGGKLKLVAQADDGSYGELPIEITGDVEGVVIELAPRANFAGTVVDAKGNPAAGVSVSLRNRDAAKAAGGLTIDMGGANMPGTHAATTRDDGGFAVKGIEPGRYDVTVEDRNVPLAWAKPADANTPDAPISHEVPEAGLAGVNLVIEARDGVIRGEVVDADGQPVPDAWVTAYREGAGAAMMAARRGAEPEQRRAETAPETEPDTLNLDLLMGKERPVLTDERGGFVIERLRSGTYTLLAEAERGSERVRKTKVALGTKARLQLGSLGSITGVVTHAGKGADEIQVSIDGPVDRSKRVHEPSGRFRVDRLEAGHYRVEASAKQGTATAEVDVVEGEAADVELEIEGWASLRGVVVDATGNGVAGLTIMVEDDPSAKSVMSLFTGGGPKTDAQGRFELAEVPPGDGRLTFFERDAIESGSNAAASYHVEGGGSVDLGTITAVRVAKVPPDQRGTLGLSVIAATWDKRPRAKGDDDERPAPDALEHLWVIGVDIGGPAETAGVEPGDEVTAIDGQAVGPLGASTARGLLGETSVRVGQDVRLELDRRGMGRTVTVVARSRGPADANTPPGR